MLTSRRSTPCSKASSCATGAKSCLINAACGFFIIFLCFRFPPPLAEVAWFVVGVDGLDAVVLTRWRFAEGVGVDILWSMINAMCVCSSRVYPSLRAKDGLRQRAGKRGEVTR